MMGLETQAPHWEWYYIAMYFFIGGVSAGAYFIGSLVEIIGDRQKREISRIAFYIAFPLILITPVLLIADLGQPIRFWHLFLYSKSGLPYMNVLSPLHVGTWALLIYGGMSLLSFLNNLVSDGRIKSPQLTNFFNHVPHRVYAAIGSFFGFFVAGYTGVLLNITTRPLWASTDPLVGPLFIISGASTGAAAIALVIAWKEKERGDLLDRLGVFDRAVMVAELAVIVLMIIIAGRFAAPILKGAYGLMFLGGVVLLGIIVPLGLHWYSRKPGAATSTLVTLTSLLVLLGGALLRISLVQAGQM